MLSEIEEENKNRSQKFFHIIHSNWKYSFGTEESWKAKLPKDLSSSIPTCEMEFNDLSSDFLK